MELILAPAPIGHELARLLRIQVLGSGGASLMAQCEACGGDRSLLISEAGDARCSSCHRTWEPFAFVRDHAATLSDAIDIAHAAGVPVPGDDMIAAVNEATGQPQVAKPSRNGATTPSKMRSPVDGIPPYSEEAEQAVVISLFTKSGLMAEVAGILSPEDFHCDGEKTVYSTMLEIYREGDPPLHTLVFQRLKDTGRLEKLAGMPHLTDLAAIAAQQGDLLPISHVLHYARIVRELSDRRRIIARARDIVDMGLWGVEAAELRTTMLDAAGEIESKDAFKIEWVDAYDLITGDFSVEYLIPGILARGQSCGIIAPPKCLKTNLAADMAVSLALGGRFLGYWPEAAPCRVGFISIESGLPALNDVFSRISAAAGHKPEDLRGKLIVSPSRPNLADLLHIQEIERNIERQKLDVLFLDPAYLMMDLDGREGSLFAVGAQLRNIDAVCQKHGTTFVLLHHATAAAGRSEQPPALQDAAWSGFAAFFRQWIVLRHREEFDPATGSSRLWMRSGGSAGHYDLHGLTVSEGRRDDPDGRRWEVTVEKIDDIRRELTQRKTAAKNSESDQWLEVDRSEIIGLLIRNSTGITKTDLKETLGIRDSRLKPAISSLLRDKTIEVIEIRKGNNRPYPGYRLHPDKSDS